MLIFYSNKRTNLNRHCKVAKKPDYPCGPGLPRPRPLPEITRSLASCLASTRSCTQGCGIHFSIFVPVFSVQSPGGSRCRKLGYQLRETSSHSPLVVFTYERNPRGESK